MKSIFFFVAVAFFALQLEAAPSKAPVTRPSGKILDVNSPLVKDIALKGLTEYNSKNWLPHLVTLKSIDSAIWEDVFCDCKYIELTVVDNSNCPHAHTINCDKKPKDNDRVSKLTFEATTGDHGKTYKFKFL